jgi:uncharacterized membrane protein
MEGTMMLLSGVLMAVAVVAAIVAAAKAGAADARRENLQDRLREMDRHTLEVLRERADRRRREGRVARKVAGQ